MGKKIKKSTKKFQKNTLPKVLEQRRTQKKIRDKERAKEDRKTQRISKEATTQSDNAAFERKPKTVHNEDESKEDQKKAPGIEDLDVDQFMEGSFFDGEEGGAESDEGELPAELKDDDDASADELARHRKELEALRLSDPEFYEHLQKSDKSLLNFEDEDGDVEDGDNEEVAPGKKANGKGKKAEKPTKAAPNKKKKYGNIYEITMPQLKELLQLASNNSVAALKKVLTLFHAAAHVSDPAKKGEKEDPELSARKIKVSGSAIYSTLMRYSFSSIPPVFVRLFKPLKPTGDQAVEQGKGKGKETPQAKKKRMLAEQAKKHKTTPMKKGNKKQKKQKDEEADEGDEGDDLEIPDDEDDDENDDEEDEAEGKVGGGFGVAGGVKSHPRWRILGPLLKSYVGNSLHFLNLLGESGGSGGDPTLVRYVLTSLEGVIPLYEPFSNFASKLLKILLKIWAGNSEDHVRIDAFLRIRELCLSLPARMNLLDSALKGIYLTFVRNSKFTSEITLPRIIFAANCVVELYGIDPSSSYHHAFVYIRQLAIHLRNALMTKTKDSHKAVYNWQYLNCLRVWSMVLAAHGKPGAALYPLVYPFLQVCLGALELHPAPVYFPLRLHVAKYVNNLCKHTKVYCPVTSHMLVVLDAMRGSPGKGKGGKFAAKQKGANGKKRPENPPKMHETIRVSDTMIQNKVYQDMLVKDTLTVLLQHFALVSTSIAYPELVFPTRAFLKRLLKEVKVPSVGKQISTFVQKLDQNTNWILQKRKTVQYSPQEMITKGISGLSTFGEDAGASAAISPLDNFVQLQGKSEEEKVLEAGPKKTSKKDKQKKAEADDDEDDDEDDDDGDEGDAGEGEGDEGDIGQEDEIADENGAEEEEGGEAEGDVVQDLVISDADDE